MLNFSSVRTLASYFLCGLTVILSIQIAQAGQRANVQENQNDAIPFSLSISGGVSLGSYEAGLNWTLLHYLKILRANYEQSDKHKFALFPELSSLSGASAGSINALFSAISWCVDDSKAKEYAQNNKVSYEFNDTLQNNLFRDIWVTVGIGDLLPDPSVKANYSHDDGLFTRYAFDEAITNLRSTLKQAIFREDCFVPFGITVTRVEPGEISVAGVKVKNQRFMIPFRIEADPDNNNKAVIVAHIVNKNDADMGNVMYLQGNATSTEKYVIAIDDLVDSILTSSAFPVAFGRKKLQYCSRDLPGTKSVKSNKCPEGYFQKTDVFLDGGVFDNIPLGIAKALAEPKPTDYNLKKKWKKSARRYNYVYIDPDNLRETSPERVDNNLEEKVIDSTQKMTYGLAEQLSFLGGAINTGRNYELYNLLRAGDWSRQSFTISCQLYSTIHNINDE